MSEFDQVNAKKQRGDVRLNESIIEDSYEESKEVSINSDYRPSARESNSKQSSDSDEDRQEKYN